MRARMAPGIRKKYGNANIKPLGGQEASPSRTRANASAKVIQPRNETVRRIFRPCVI